MSQTPAVPDSNGTNGNGSTPPPTSPVTPPAPPAAQPPLVRHHVRVQRPAPAQAAPADGQANLNPEPLLRPVQSTTLPPLPAPAASDEIKLGFIGRIGKRLTARSTARAARKTARAGNATAVQNGQLPTPVPGDNPEQAVRLRRARILTWLRRYIVPAIGVLSAYEFGSGIDQMDSQCGNLTQADRHNSCNIVTPTIHDVHVIMIVIAVFCVAFAIWLALKAFDMHRNFGYCRPESTTDAEANAQLKKVDANRRAKVKKLYYYAAGSFGASILFVVLLAIVN